MFSPGTSCTPETPRNREIPAALRRLVPALLVGLTACADQAQAAVHYGGAGSCAVCHIMHDGVDGQVAFDGSRPLLVAANSTDLCLLCHGAGGVFELSPLAAQRERGAGNFVWLLENNLNDALNGTLFPIRGEAAGHSIVSPDRGTYRDSRWDRAPGGTFPSEALGCTSCHDPHGSGGYRMLNGAGPVQGGLANFTYPAPTGEGLDIADAVAEESPTKHSAYRAGMSRWCANCHGQYHSGSSRAAFEHPTDEDLGGGEGRRYNRYDGDADPTGGSSATAYIPEVPFEGPATSTGSTAGPTGADHIMCLTCHRAHASSAPASGRWDFNVYRLAQDGVVSGSYALPSPYPTSEQGQLCRKCHAENHDQGQACVGCHVSGQRALLPASLQP